MKRKITVLLAAFALLLAGCSQAETTVAAGEGGTTSEDLLIMPGGAVDGEDFADDGGIKEEAEANGTEAITEIAFESTLQAETGFSTEIATAIDTQAPTEQEQNQPPLLQLTYEAGELACCMNIYSPSYIWNGLCVDGAAAVTGGYKANLYADSAQIRLDFAGADAPDSVVVSCGEADSETESVLSDDLVFEAEAGKKYTINAVWGDNSACYVFAAATSDALPSTAEEANRPEETTTAAAAYIPGEAIS